MLEVECRRAGKPVVFVDLPIPGIDSEPHASSELKAVGAVRSARAAASNV
jgi:hypothetical protein